MKILSYFILISILTWDIGCSNEQVKVVEKTTQIQKLSDDNVFKGYETAVDKAKAVEQTIMDAAEQRALELEEQGL